MAEGTQGEARQVKDGCEQHKRERWEVEDVNGGEDEWKTGRGGEESRKEKEKERREKAGQLVKLK